MVQVILMTRVRCFPFTAYYSLTGSPSQIYAVYERSKLILLVMALLFAGNIISAALIVYLGPPGGNMTLSKTLHSI